MKVKVDTTKLTLVKNKYFDIYELKIKSNKRLSEYSKWKLIKRVLWVYTQHLYKLSEHWPKEWCV